MRAVSDQLREEAAAVHAREIANLAGAHAREMADRERRHAAAMVMSEELAAAQLAELTRGVDPPSPPRPLISI
eukprot:COSAG01_NODE_24139_length_786_cov_0.817391_2_plen_73_part_00